MSSTRFVSLPDLKCCPPGIKIEDDLQVFIALDNLPVPLTFDISIIVLRSLGKVCGLPVRPI